MSPNILATYGIGVPMHAPVRADTAAPTSYRASTTPRATDDGTEVNVPCRAHVVETLQCAGHQVTVHLGLAADNHESTPCSLLPTAVVTELQARVKQLQAELASRAASDKENRDNAARACSMASSLNEDLLVMTDKVQALLTHAPRSHTHCAYLRLPHTCM